MDTDNVMTIFALVFCLSYFAIDKSKWCIFGRLLISLTILSFCLWAHIYMPAIILFVLITFEVKRIIWSKKDKDQIRQEIKEVIKEDTDKF